MSMVNDALELWAAIKNAREDTIKRVRNADAQIAFEVEINALRAGKKEIADAAKAIGEAIKRQSNADSTTFM